MPYMKLFSLKIFFIFFLSNKSRRWRSWKCREMQILFGILYSTLKVNHIWWAERYLQIFDLTSPFYYYYYLSLLQLATYLHIELIFPTENFLGWLCLQWWPPLLISIFNFIYQLQKCIRPTNSKWRFIKRLCISVQFFFLHNRQG